MSHDAAMDSEAARHRAAAIVPVMILFLAGCSIPKGEVTYEPDFIPVEFSLDSSWTFGVSLGKSIATPVGRFGINAKEEASLVDKTKENGTQAVILRVAGATKEDVFEVKEKGPFAICLDGQFEETVNDSTITVTAQTGQSRVGLGDPKASHPCDAFLAKKGSHTSNVRVAYKLTKISFPGAGCTNEVDIELDPPDGPRVLTGGSWVNGSGGADLQLVNCGPDSQNTLHAGASSFARSETTSANAWDCDKLIKQQPEGKDVQPKKGMSLCLWTSDGNLAHVIIDKISTGDNYKISARVEAWLIL